MKEQQQSLKTSYLLRRFYIFFLVFAIVPFLVLFYLYTQYSDDNKLIAVDRDRLSLLIGMVGAGCILGFFGMKTTLTKIVLFVENLRKSLFGKVDKKIVLDLAKEEGEVAELAKSFGDIFNRLEENIKELEDTKKTLHDVLSKISKALSSMENFDVLVKLILTTALDALGAKTGAIFSADGATGMELRAHAGFKDVDDKQIFGAAQVYTQWLMHERRMLYAPSLDNKNNDESLFSAPFVGMPLLLRDKLWGVVCVSGKKRGGNFSDDELKLITNISYQIAVAFENAQLNQDMERTYFETAAALALAVEARDPYSRGHSERVGEYSVKIGKKMGINDKDVQILRDAARLHDIGKIGITDSILRKQSALDGEEREIMRKHPLIGESIVMPLKSFRHLVEPIRHHHEFLDGSGYPDGLKADQINLVTKIMTVADIFDAISTDRPYHKGLSFEDTIKELYVLVKQGKVDKLPVDAFNDLIKDKQI